MRNLLAFLFGGAVVVAASSMAKKRGRVPDEFAKGGALSDAGEVVKAQVKDAKALAKKYTSKEKRRDLLRLKGKAWKEYGKDVIGNQVKDVKRKGKFLAEHPEVLTGKFASGGYINSGGVNRLIDFLQFNRTTAAAKTSEQLGKEYKLPKFQVEAIRRAVKSNYTHKEIYDMLQKMNN